MTRRRFIHALAGIPASACFGGFAIPAFAATVRKVALVVGNAGYAGTERLKNPVADATLTANTLRKLGFHTSLATDRNTAQLKAELDDFGQAARGGDIVVFFYACLVYTADAADDKPGVKCGWHGQLTVNEL